jgi:hypothetical protein
MKTRPSASLQEDLLGDLVRAALADQLDRVVQVGFAVGEALGGVERVAGLDEHVHAPPGDLCRLAVAKLERMCDLRHAHEKFALAAPNPAALQLPSCERFLAQLERGHGYGFFPIPNHLRSFAMRLAIRRVYAFPLEPVSTAFQA